MTPAAAKAFASRYRLQAELIGVACAAIVACIVLGVAARRRLVTVRSQQAAVSSVATELANFRASFQSSVPSADSAETLPDSFAVAVPREDRVSLAGKLASRAELDGLSSVRVNFAPPDSATAPQTPVLFDSDVTVANYAVAMDCDGSFASVLAFVNQLPPSVALQRIAAARDKTGAHFHLVLAVFESTGGVEHG